MATMIDGESYLGRVMVRPLSKSGDVTMYLWPLRCLKAKFGGPTFGHADDLTVFLQRRSGHLPAR